MAYSPPATVPPSKIELSSPPSKTTTLPPAPPLSPLPIASLLHKLDTHLLPPLTTLFLLAFLDRTNIGNAKIQGMTSDLHMRGSDYNVALFVFFIPYILLEVPSNLILRRMKPSTWLSGIMVGWGVCTVGLGVVRRWEGVVGLRIGVGVFEAGLFPGCTYLLSTYYPRHTLSPRLTLFFTASILASALSSLLAFALSRIHTPSYPGWRWIFLLEGLLTVLVGVASKFLIPDWPETASFLSTSERASLVALLDADNGDAHMDRLDMRAVRRILRDGKMWLGTVMYFGVVNTGYAGSFFIPSILRELGFTAEGAQVRAIPIFVVAAIATLSASYLSDRLRHRFWFIIFGLVVASVGYIILLCGEAVSAGVKYFALFLVVPGGYIAQPIVLVWMSNLMSGHYKRAVSSGLQVGLGNVGGIVASNIFLEREAKGARYPTGYGVSLGMLWICGVASVVLLFYVKKENRRRERGERNYRLDEEDSGNLGDDHPHFRFMT